MLSHGIYTNIAFFGKKSYICRQKSPKHNKMKKLILLLAALALSSCSKYDFRGGLLGDKAHSVVFDNTKLKRAVPGLSMNVRFEQGVRKTLEYVLSHPECQVEDPEFDAWCDKVIAELEAAKKRIMEG